VPPGFVVSAEACQSFFSDIDLEQEVKQLSDSHPDTWGDHCEEIQRKLHAAEMGRGIWNLAKTAKKEPRLKALFEKEKPENIMDALGAMPESEQFQNMLQRFLSKNGHRGLKELELQSLRWEENPTPVLGMIRNYMLMETDPGEHERRVTQTRSDLETEIQKGLSGHAGERIFHLRWHLVCHLMRAGGIEGWRFEGAEGS
jgi:hypothetical protein